MLPPHIENQLEIHFFNEIICPSVSINIWQYLFLHTNLQLLINYEIKGVIKHSSVSIELLESFSYNDKNICKHD